MYKLAHVFHVHVIIAVFLLSKTRRLKQDMVAKLEMHRKQENGIQNSPFCSYCEL